MGKLGFGMWKREHRYVEVRLSAYVDDEVSDRERRRIEAHLAHCGECRAELRALRWTVSLLRQAPPVKAPRLFVVREADLAKERRPARRRAPLLVTQWATAAVALLFVLILGADLLVGRGLPQVAGVPLRGGREEVAVTQLVEREVVVTQVVEKAVAEEVVVEEAIEQQADQVARAAPEATAPPMPTVEARVEAEAAPVEGEVTKEVERETANETPMAMKAPEGVGGGGGPVTATQEAEVMLAQPAPATTPTGAAATAEALEATSLPPEPPEAEMQLDVAAEAVKETERVLPTPVQPSEEYGLTAWAHEEGAVRRDVLLLWRGAEVVLGIALVGLLVAVVWMRSRR
jgi:anti-sigma factor RsiW